MKFTTRTITEQAEHTIDGITAPITRNRTVSVPRMPRDWDTVAIRGASGLVLVLTLISVLWSTWSIGSLLHGGIGYIAATIFDVAWAVCLLLEWLARFDQGKRAFPRRLGWGLLIATMLAIGWHGLTMHSVPMAVTGAAISAFAKALWLGVMKHIDRDLSADDAQWVAAQISASNAKLAVAGVRRQVARQEARAVLELTAMEAERAELAMALGVPLGDLSGSVVPPASGMVLAGSAVEPQQEAKALPSDAATVASLPQIVEMLRNATATEVADAAQHDVADATEMDPEPLEPPTLALLSKADAVRIALRKRPSYTVRQIVELLAVHDVRVTDSYVRQVKARDAAVAASATQQGATRYADEADDASRQDADVLVLRAQN